ncbi:MAG: glycosyltransferase family 2 protein [Gammaproteobacteria bacterium]|nr:glycosyltransferase family 2 protein [Gammaproteobacteria bacterium]
MATPSSAVERTRPSTHRSNRPTQLTVSAVIPTKDRPQDLHKAVESLLRQTLLPTELIVVDQSGSNASKDIVLGLPQWKELDVVVNYIHDPSVRGLVPAKEVASQRSQCDVVLFLEDDVILEPDFIEKILLGFDEKPEMMGSCGVIVQMPNSNWRYRFLFHVFHRGIFRDPRVGIFGIPQAWDRKWIQSVYLSGGLTAFRREVFDEVPFDTQNGFFIMEDVDFSTRAAKCYGKNRFFINTQARLHHVFSPVNRAKERDRQAHKVRIFICFYKKNKSQPLALFNLLWLMVGLFLEAGVKCVQCRSIGPILGFFKGIYLGIKWRILPEKPSTLQ